MDYTNQASYSSFLISEMLQQIDIEAAIREAAILAEGGDISELDVLTESVFDKVKEVWDKFVAFIKRIWAKFSETMMSVFDVDKPYLEKYRDIILKKPVQFTSVSMRNYQIDLITKATLEPFDYNMMKDDLVDRSKLAHRFIDEFKEDESTEDLAGWCKSYFCGGSEETEEITDPAAKLSMSSMFDYCYTWKDKMLPVLNKDITAINNSTTKAMNLMKKAEDAAKANANKAQTQEPAAQTQTTQTSQPAAQNAQSQKPVAAQASQPATAQTTQSTTTQTAHQNSANLFDPDTRYSYLYEAEVKTDTKTTGSTTTTKGTTVRADQTAAAAVKSGVVDDKKTTVDGADDLKALEDCIDNYSYVASKIAASKLTVCEWAYKEYMQVIKAHVKQQLGNKEDNPDQSVQKGQTYDGKGGETSDGKKPAEVPQATT